MAITVIYDLLTVERWKIALPGYGITENFKKTLAEKDDNVEVLHLVVKSGDEGCSAIEKPIKLTEYDMPCVSNQISVSCDQLEIDAVDSNGDQIKSIGALSGKQSFKGKTYV